MSVEHMEWYVVKMYMYVIAWLNLYSTVENEITFSIAAGLINSLAPGLCGNNFKSVFIVEN